MSAVLDSTVLIDVLRKRPEARAYLRSLTQLPTCSEVTRVEILTGLRSHERAPAEELFQLLRWEPMDERVAREAGELGRRYRRSHGLGATDLIVAATAKLAGLPLATSNVKHYPMFPRLKSPY